ncbi:Protein SPT2 [Desmophyllum pertusum]|uniref:Protein SPT2 n=1 Tax=Desmophyllum pertusum TaxID=174260 RepID=A0A9W9Z0I9_9CNID|nr:Protein SPT2 [Desmophyllum pertusum]
MSSSAGAAASHGKLSNSKYNNPSSDRRPVKEGHLGLKRDRVDLKRKRNPYLDEMDDFIDDGDDDDEDDDAPDVSKYIREIFGYDKSRFNDADDDLTYMDSNFSQIEKEEQNCSKIARLEDEIEQLKELADLKKQRDKLKKKSKK